ncbi:MAG TPA: helix-turn-helix domain-containing protein [Candidatus Scybalocola faecipullorum]|nr:helix-turn-helix domain-containing protein [Candidatus Scybalocola faecipullorum]
MEIYDETQPLDLNFPLRMNKMWLRKDSLEFVYYHKHHYYEITCILNGHGFISVNGRRFKLEPGDVVLFNIDEVHGWELTEDMRIFVMVFSSELIFDKVSLFDYEYLRFFEENGSHFVNRIPHEEIYAKKIYGVMEDIYNEWVHDHDGRELMMKSFVLRILTMLTRHYKNSPKDSRQCQIKNEQMQRLQEVIAYVSECYDQKITLEDAAQKAYMNANYFSAFFKKVMGETFSHYLIKIRIYKARELILTGRYNVLEVSQMCGYNNISNFYRAYKKIFGKTPKDNEPQQ